MNYREIRNRFRIIPFGKFSSSGRGRPPFNQVFVGRSRERASFIEALIHQEKFGAFLVSGRRGSGKSSFVDYVLGQYEKASFQRFIRFARNHRMADFTLGLSLVLGLCLIYILTTQLVELLSNNASINVANSGNHKHGTGYYWVWLPMLATTILPLLMMQFAARGLDAYSLLAQKKSDATYSAVIMPIIIIGLLAQYFLMENIIIKNLFPIDDKNNFGLSTNNWVFIGILFSPFMFIIGLVIRKIYKKSSGNRLHHIIQIRHFSSFLLLIIIVTLVSVFSINPKFYIGEEGKIDLLPKFGISNAILLCFFVLCSLTFANTIVSCFRYRTGKGVNPKARYHVLKSLTIVFEFFLAAIFTLLFLSLKTLFIPEPNNLYYNYAHILFMLNSTVLCLAGADLLRIREGQGTWLSRVGANSNYFFLWTFLSFAAWVILLFYSSDENAFVYVALAPASSAMFFLFLKFLSIKSRAKQKIKSKEYDGNFHNRAPIEALLLTKSTLLFFFAFTLIIPILKVLFPIDWNFDLGSADLLLEDESVVILASTVFLIFILEYSWISRSLAPERYDFTLAPLGRESHHAQIENLWGQNEDGLHSWQEKRDQDNNGTSGNESLVPDWWDSRPTNIFRFKKAQLGNVSSRRRQITEKLEQATFAHFFYEGRVPVIISRINLGFDDLRHSRIVEAMLVQLRDRYRERLIAPFSKVGMTTIAISTLVFIVFVNLAAKNFFDLNEQQKQSATIAFSTDEQPAGYDYCGHFRKENAEYRPAANGLICILPWPNSVYEVLYSPILKLSMPEYNSGETGKILNEKSLIFRFFLHENFGLPSPLNKTDEASNASPAKKQPILRGYHILVGVIIFFLMQYLNSILGIFPYSMRVAEMTRLLELIRGKITYSKADMPKVGWLRSLLGLQRRDESIQTEPDPRIVEQSFIDLLFKINPSQKSRDNSLFNWFEVRPEMVFVFDEMDKLSGMIDPETSRVDEAAATIEENTRERQRALQLHQLLSDMKRLLSSNAARFIFIGGRLYHDEWLADQVDRTPLLSSIFSEQIYLSSLLVDREHSYGRLNDRIAEYLALMFNNAQDRMKHWQLKRRTLAFVVSRNIEEPTYVQSKLPHSGHPKRLAAMAHYLKLRVVDENGDYYGRPVRTNDDAVLSAEAENRAKKELEINLTYYEIETLEQLVNFLTYRSAGNPKKIKEILQGFMLPSSNAFDLPRHDTESQRYARHDTLIPHHDAVLLDDKRLYRIQFIDILYRHLAEHLECRMLERDDKVSMSIFYLMDFLLKFHNRGFSWTNLQRVDELSHIHRAPDLRSMMGVLVDASSERFLHRVLNGVYAFRFRSDFAREIDYLSRISKEEMAALNFTLDESQDLKGLYQETINRGDHENVDTISGLGELYEYDQDYEIARNYYRRAIAVLDNTYNASIASQIGAAGKDKISVKSKRKRRSYKTNITGSGVDETTFSPMGVIMQDVKSDAAKRAIKSNFSWSIARLRLLLQIGHTYEQERNFERALGSYMHAHQFSLAILNAMNKNGFRQSKSSKIASPITPQNYSILYQAVLAGAWIFEKGNQDTDESIAHVEMAISDLYKSNPILFRQDIDEWERHSYRLRKTKFSMLMFASDIHDRVGDLYFYKGKQSARLIKDYEAFQLALDNDKDQLRFGYLMEAHYHYALSIWNVRHYLDLRNRSSRIRLNILERDDEKLPVKKWYERYPLKNDSAYPDLVQNSLANSFTDMSEAILARASMGKLMRCLMGFTKHTDNISAETFIEERRKFKKSLNRSIEHFIQNIPALTRNNGMEPKDRLKKFQLFSNFGDDARFENSTLFNLEIRGGTGSVWLGNGDDWPSQYKSQISRDFKSSRSLRFTEIVQQNERLNATLFFSSLAAKNFGNGGYFIDAANEYLLQAQSLVSLIWNIRQLEWLAKNGSPSAVNQIRQMLFPRRRILEEAHQNALILKFVSVFDAEQGGGSPGIGPLEPCVEKWIKDSDLSHSDILKKLFKKIKSKWTNETAKKAVKSWVLFQAHETLELRSHLLHFVQKQKNSRSLFKKMKLYSCNNELRRFWEDYISKHARVKKNWFHYLDEDPLEQSWRNFSGWINEDDDDYFEAAKLQLGTMAHIALERAANAIQISHRPSATTIGQNHGNPIDFSENVLNQARSLLFNIIIGTSKHADKSSALDKALALKDDDIAEAINSNDNVCEFATYLNSDIGAVSTKDEHKEVFTSLKTRLNEYKEINPPSGSTPGRADFGTKLNELDDDYRSSQAWRDEPRLATTAAQLVLALGSMKTASGNDNASVLAGVVYDEFLYPRGNKCYPDRKARGKAVSSKDMRSVFNGLYHQSEKFRFPVLNRLRSLSVIVEAAIIHGEEILFKPEWCDEAEDANIWRPREHAALIGRLCRELSFTSELYDSENHFSPHLPGMTLGMAFYYATKTQHPALYDSMIGDEWDNERVKRFVVKGKRDWKDKPSLSATIVTREALGEIAINLLRRSEQMFSMGKAYYENIANLQYLNDDFNDRVIHNNHANRMLNSEMINFMISSIHDDIFPNKLS
ncbi:MAG: hypothetical protein AAF217_10465 [Pseudomonadota bacterium]